MKIDGGTMFYKSWIKHSQKVLWLLKMRRRLTTYSLAVWTICRLWAPRWSGSSPAPPSLTCWWRGTPWWSGSTPRSRSALMYNKVKTMFTRILMQEYCKEKHGLEFQVVDMRWGVRWIVVILPLVNLEPFYWSPLPGMRWPMSTPPLPSAWTSWEDVKSLAWVQTLYTLELRNMVTGWHEFAIHLYSFPITPFRPIPSEIVTEELDKLIAVLEAMSNDTTLLKKWYRKDTNKVWTIII